MHRIGSAAVGYYIFYVPLNVFIFFLYNIPHIQRGSRNKVFTKKQLQTLNYEEKMTKEFKYAFV